MIAAADPGVAQAQPVVAQQQQQQIAELQRSLAALLHQLQAAGGRRQLPCWSSLLPVHLQAPAACLASADGTVPADAPITFSAAVPIPANTSEGGAILSAQSLASLAHGLVAAELCSWDTSLARFVAGGEAAAALSRGGRHPRDPQSRRLQRLATHRRMCSQTTAGQSAAARALRRLQAVQALGTVRREETGEMQRQQEVVTYNTTHATGRRQQRQRTT